MWPEMDSRTNVFFINKWHFCFIQQLLFLFSKHLDIMANVTDCEYGKTYFIFRYVVNRLDPYTPYEFLVIPFHRGLSGKPSALHRAQTLEARPHLAPIHLQWYQVFIHSPQFRGLCSMKKLQRKASKIAIFLE